MKALLLAGGKGTRLRPYTAVLPKPLMPIGEFPILDIVIRQLKAAGITDIVISVGYLSQLIESYFGDGERWGVGISYSREETPLGTAGPISLLENIEEPFLVMNGDILTDLHFASFCNTHKASNSLATVAMYKKKIKVELGTLKCNRDMHIIDYIEKPTLEYDVSTGIYMFSPRIKDYLVYNQRLDLPDLIRKLIDNGESVCGYPLEGLWFDLGRKEDYEEINERYSGDIELTFIGGQSAPFSG